jgi:LPS-assembly protein
MESGSSLTLGFDYEKNNKDNELNFSIGQIINEKKSNKRMPSASSLDKRFSDIIGNMNYSNKENFKVNYDFNLDQNYKEMRYNKVDAEYDTGRISFNLKYLEEEKTLTNNEYIKSSLQFKKGNSSVISFENKRDLINSSSDYYRLSYEYINDCLRAGLVYRREFYDDSELEPENSLMFKITLSPFGSITSPSFSQ